MDDRIFDNGEGWEMDDGSGFDSWYRYMKTEHVEPWEVSTSGPTIQHFNIDELTIFSLYFHRGRDKQDIFRELAMHPETDVQVDYLYLEG